MTKAKARNLYKLERWCMRRWQRSAAQCNALAAQGGAEYARWSKRADQWFAACERVARLSRPAHS